MARGRHALRLLPLVAALACAPDDEHFTLPWWPAPAVAEPSPLLDAVGLAPPPLAGPGCHRGGGSAERSGLRAALARLARGFEVTCVQPATAAASDADGYAAATFDAEGRAESADRRNASLPPAAAAAAADSIVRRGLALPGARPLACPMEGWPYAVLRSDGAVPLVRGWRTPDYEALVLAYPAALDPARDHVVHVRVSRFGFAACRPRRA